MPIARFQMPDGKVGRFEVPDGTSPEQAQELINSYVASSPELAPKVEKPSEDSSDLVRGFTNYLPQLKETYGGAKVLAGKAAGSQELMKSGLETMEEAKHALRGKSKETDSFTTALDKGIEAVLTDWLPYQVGSGAANLLESLAVMGAGAAAGSVVPGLGTAVGGVTGLVSKKLVKEGVEAAAKKIAAEQGEEIAKQYVENQTKLAAKAVAKEVAGTAALGVQAGFHGTGETTSRAVGEAERLGKEATDIDLERVLPAAGVHAVAEFFGDKIGLGAFNKIDVGSKNLLLNFSKNLLTTGTKETPVEVVQSMAERFGAKMSLADAEAVKEYVDAAAAAYGMSVGPAAGGAVRTVGQARMDEEQKRLTEAAEANEKMDAERQAGIEAGETAEDTAAQITKVGQVDEQGNVTPLPEFTAVIPGQQINPSATQNTELGSEDTGALPAAQATALSNDVIEKAYFDNDVSTAKVLKALKPELEAAGITDPNEQKAFLKQKMVEMSIPTIDTGASKSEQGKQRRIKDQWKANYPARIEAKKDLPKENINVDQSDQANIDPNQSGAPSIGGELGGTSTGAKTPDASGVDVTTGDVERDTGAEEVQRPALTPQQLKDGYTLLLEQHDDLPSWKDLTPDMKKAFMPEIEGVLKTKGMLPSKGAAPEVSSAIAALKKVRAIVDSYNENRPGKMRQWSDLNDDERDLYLSNIRNNTAEEQDKAYAVLQGYLKSNEQITEEGEIEAGAVPEGASIYELNRQAYSAQLPRWGELDNDARNLFLKSIKPGLAQKERKVTTEQMDTGFADVWIHNAEKEARTVSPLKQREEKAQVERKQRMQEEREEVPVGKELPTNIKQMLKDGDIKGVLNYLSKNSKGMAYTVPYKAGRVQDDVVLFFQKQREFISSTVFKKLSSVLSSVTYNSKVVIDPNNEYIQQLKKEGKLAAYDPKTDTFYFTKDGLDEQTVLHEIVHAATIKIMYAFKTNPNSLTKEQREAAEHIEKIYEAAKKNVSLKNKHANAFENVYEFVSYAMTDVGLQQDLANIQSPNLSKYTAKNLGFLRSLTGRFGSLWGQFTQSLMKLYGLVRSAPTFVPANDISETFIKTVNEESQQTLGYDNRSKGPQGRIVQRPGKERATPESISEAFKQPGYQGNLVIEMSEAFGRILAAPEGGVDLEALPAKAAPPAADRTVEELKDDIKTGAPDKLKDKAASLLSSEGAERMTTLFQNNRAAIKRWQERLLQQGRIISFGLGFNNIYDQLTLSSGNAHFVYTQRVQNLTEDIRAGVVEFANKNNITVDRALQSLGLYAIGQHVEERRNTLYTLEVPLEDSAPILVDSVTGKTITPFQAREDIKRILNSRKLTKAQSESLWKQLTKIVNDPANLSRDPKKKELLDKNSTKYSVAAEYSKAQLDAIKKDYNRYKDTAEPVLKSIKKLNDVTLKLNKESNYLSEYADNWINFYGWENYIPLKGKSDDQDSPQYSLNYDSRKLSGELQESVHTFTGRISQPDNPVLQVLADSAQAAMRVGRKYVTESIYNAAKKSKLNPNGTDVLNAEVIKVIDFEERASSSVMEDIKGNTKIFHYMPDGKVAIIQINDNRLLEAIRRTYKDSNPYVDLLNKATSFVGQTHTRYNLAFAPVNFVRDVLTNAYTLGAELGPEATFNYLGAIAADVAQGKMFKTNKFSRLYSKGNVKEIEALAEKDAYYKDLLDYVKTGGRVSYIAGLANRGQYDELYKGLGGNKIVQTKEQVDKVFDAWIDTFELSARVSAYRIAKSNEIARLTKEKSPKTDEERKEIDKAASIRAAAYSKNLANFEQVGEWGKVLGAFFMFFRPSATGAVRAMEAIAPAFQSLPQARLRLPEFAHAARLREKLKGEMTADARKATEKELKEYEGYISKFESNFAERQKSARVMSVSLIGMGFAVYMMSKMMADDDELKRNKLSTDDMSRWTKFARFFIPGFENPIQIPWGFGLGGLAALGAQLAAISDNNVKLRDTLGNIVTIGMDSFLPLPVSRINPFEKPREFFIDSMTPSIVRPLVEYSLNVDALGRQIYNNRQSRFGDAYTGGDNIPEAYKSAARKWFDLTGYDVSPNSLYFFANNYADGASRILVQAPVNLTMFLTGKKEFNWKTDTMVLDSFIGTPSNFDARTWQKIEDDLKDRAQKLSMLEDKPEKYYAYLAKNPMDQILVDMYNHDANGYLKDLRAEANKYRAMEGLTPKERNNIVKLYVKMANMEKYRLVEMYKAFGVKP
jgi:hypothetical protein